MLELWATPYWTLHFLTYGKEYQMILKHQLSECLEDYTIQEQDVIDRRGGTAKIILTVE